MTPLIVTIWIVFAMTTMYRTVEAMKEEDAIPGIQVKFEWNDKSRKKQNNQTIIRIAEALNGQICVIMERPFYFDKTRTRIQSVDHPELTLAVKLKHLEIVQSPEWHIDLLIPRKNVLTNNIRYIASDQYLQKELEIAADPQYQIVLLNNQEAVSRSPISSNRITIDTRQRALVSWLFEEFLDFLDCVRGIEYTDTDARKLIARSLWYIWKAAEGKCVHHGVSMSPLQQITEDDIFHYLSPECLKMVHTHLMKVQEENRCIAPDKITDPVIGEFCLFFPFALKGYLNRTMVTYQQRFEALEPKLNGKASQFYKKHLLLLQELLGVGPIGESQYTKMLTSIVRVAGKAESVKRELIRKQKDIMNKGSQSVDAMKHYLSVGELLVQMRDSTAEIGKIGIICLKDYVNGDWIRALSDIMQCNNRSVSMKII